MRKNVRRGLARRDQTPEVDAEAVKQYWNGLNVDEKLSLLQFDDNALVAQVANIQQELLHADMQCYQLGIRGQDAVREAVGMNQFILARDATSFNPVVFGAKQEFIERSDFFECIESHLGTTFLQTSTKLRRRDWCSLLEPSARSWADFMNQVLRLVELAILQAYEEAQSKTVETIASPVEDMSRNESGPEPSASLTQSQKRRARKKRNALAAQEVALEATVALEEPPPYEEHVAEPALESSPSLAEPSCGEVHGDHDVSVEPDATSEGTDIDSTGGVEKTSCREGEYLKFDWSAEGPPVDTKGESAVELQVDWSFDGLNPSETRWSAWLANGLTGSAAEWYWVGPGDPMRAFLKNTFVEEKCHLDENNLPVRARSCPAAMPRRIGKLVTPPR